jgi:hypothetical protein
MFNVSAAEITSTFDSARKKKIVKNQSITTLENVTFTPHYNHLLFSFVQPGDV